MRVTTDSLTRYLHITYSIPRDAPEVVRVECAWSPLDHEDWRPAKVMPLLSETGYRFAISQQWESWTAHGVLIEKRAAGLQRTVVFNPYPEAQQNGKVQVRFRVRVLSPSGELLAQQETPIHADNSDVLYLEDWSQVVQHYHLSTAEPKGERKWWWRTDAGENLATFGNLLTGNSASDVPLPQLTYPLNLQGWYAVYVCTPPRTGVRMRLSGDERLQYLVSPRPFQEMLWDWRQMDHQDLVIAQPHSYTGYVQGQIDYVKLVPLSEEQVRQLEAQFGKPDKPVVAFYEPYSWSFFEHIEQSYQHREPLIAFAEARVWQVDMQIGRFGAKVDYESRIAARLLHSTIGDPIEGTVPRTDNVGRLQQYTNTLQTSIRYAKELGLRLHANFGATNCYLGTPLQGDFPEKHPEWVRGHALRYEVPEVRQYVLSLIREALQIGAEGISIDFCRYPEGIDKPETCNQFLRELKALREEYARRLGKPVPLFVRFPAKGVRLWRNFDFHTWIREGLVDAICPSNIQGRHMHFDIAPYVQAVRGTRCKLLPVVDGLSWGLEMPGPFLWRVHQLYQAGVDGIYIYQADSRVCIQSGAYVPADRRTVRMVRSSQAVSRYWKQQQQLRPRCSKGIFLQPSEDGDYSYHEWERARIWLEGIEMGEVEVYLDGKLVSRFSRPPYLVGTEDDESDNVISPGEHTLLVRARDGQGWLEEEFTVQGVR
jgi:hypothetical protein